MKNLRDIFTTIGLINLILMFEDEIIDIEVLKDMSHDDLKGIGVKDFGQRHKT